MTIRRRDFPEVLDGLLTTLVGGVAGEQHPFPPPHTDEPPYEHHLEQPPAADIVSVYGRRNGTAHAFRKGVDFTLTGDGTVLAWAAEAELPDAGTVVDVSYTSEPARSALDDLSAGSVVRTLAETAALEIARLYAQLDAVYRAGFVDTASGESLDHVVALLGVERVRGGRAGGEIELTRVEGGRGEITIPAGTRIVTADGEVEYATTASVTLADRQNVVRVTARDLEPNDPVEAGTLTVLPVPIQGILAVTNPARTARSAFDETDDELRTRTKAFLGGSERATLGALRGAIARQQITADVEETALGNVVVTPHQDSLPPELEQRLLAAIEEARPAGVRVYLAAPVPPLRLDLELRLRTAPNLVESDLLAAHEAVAVGIRGYFERLPIREAASVNRIVGLALAVAGVEDVRVLSATLHDPSLSAGDAGTDVLDLVAAELKIAAVAVVLGDLRIADPALATLVSATVAYPAGGAPPDSAALRSGLNAEVATINAANAGEGGAAQTVGFAMLRDALGLSGPADQYDVVFAITQRSGFSRLLAAPDDPPYPLTPLERLSVNAVSVAAKGGDGP
jgi:hypothetical protein